MKRQVIVVMGVFLFCLGLTGTANAISSVGYAIDWSVVGAGGEAIHSTSYSANTTVGQAIVRVSHNTSYGLCSGYWCDAVLEHRIYLPVVLLGP
jgi:hypothetical protein